MARNTQQTNASAITLASPVQVGVVVKDLDNVAKALADLFGIGPFRFIEWPNRPDSKYYFRGSEQQMKIRVAFVQLGPIELELVQVLEGQLNAYRQFLDEKCGGIRHILFDTNNLDGDLAGLEQSGINVLQTGNGIRPGSRWGLLDTADHVGFFVELRSRVPGSDGASIPKEMESSVK